VSSLIHDENMIQPGLFTFTAQSS